MHKSIRWRLTGFFLLGILLTIFLLGILLVSVLEENYLRTVEERLFSETDVIRKIAGPYLRDKQSENALDQNLKKTNQNTQTRITVILPNGTVIADSAEPIDKMDNHLTRPEVKDALTKGEGISRRYSKTLKTDMYYLAMPLTDNGGKTVAIVRTALPLKNITDAFHNIEQIVLLGIVVVSFLSFFLIISLTRKFSRPIEEISLTAREISKGEFNRKIYIRNNDEIGELAATINTMSENIKEKINLLEENKKRLEAILSNMLAGVIVFDEEGKVVLANPAAKKYFGLAEVDVTGKSAIEVTRSEEISNAINSAIKYGDVTRKEITTIYPAKKTLQANVVPIDKSGLILGSVAVFHDITEIRDADRIRTDFVANVSHELQTPLAIIRGYAETLLDGALSDPEVAQKFIRIINEETERISRIVDDLLKISSLEAENFALNRKPVNLGQLVQKNIVRITGQAKKTGVNLHAIISPKPVYVLGDADWLDQMLINLIDNAVKYTPQGGDVFVEVTENDTQAQLKVRDTGIGIPLEDVPRIFERFYRVDKARSREKGGTGLGLSIVKHVVEVHGGTITVDSMLGKGTTFIVTFQK